jgi:protein polybromo-1
MWDVFLKNKKKLEEDEASLPKKIERRGRKSANNDDEESDSETDSEIYEDLFVTIMNATDPADNRLLNLQFQLLPSKKLYPDYYDVIDHPIDLKFIANKIQTNAYNCINDMEKDVMQMTKNACTFNEPGSQIYKDAKMLRKVFSSRRAEIETGKYKKVVTKKSKSVSAQIAALQELQESSDDEMEEGMENEGDGPLWQLFDQLYNTANTNGKYKVANTFIMSYYTNDFHLKTKFNISFHILSQLIAF